MVFMIFILALFIVVNWTIINLIQEGYIVEGKVKAIVDWGDFIDISGADALLHCTDLSYSRVKKTSDLLIIMLHHLTSTT